MRLFFAGIVGLVFGVGISFSGMMNPAKVLNFFDLAGAWDPSLAFVMGGALIVTGLGYRLAWRRSQPLFGGSFQIPANTKIDGKLLGGSALFGVGWGIAGFCPGAALPALGTGRWEAVLFIAAVIAGMGLRRSPRARERYRTSAMKLRLHTSEVMTVEDRGLATYSAFNKGKAK